MRLDGFCYYAEYSSTNLVDTYRGVYYFAEYGAVVFVTNGLTFYFDVNNSNKTVTMRDETYGEYFIFDNGAVTYYAELNGYGKVNLYSVTPDSSEEDGYAKTLIVSNATYTYVDGVLSIAISANQTVSYKFDVRDGETVLVGVLHVLALDVAHALQLFQRHVAVGQPGRWFESEFIVQSHNDVLLKMFDISMR